MLLWLLSCDWGFVYARKVTDVTVKKACYYLSALSGRCQTRVKILMIIQWSYEWS